MTESKALAEHKTQGRVRWTRLILAAIAFVALSFVLSALLQALAARFNFPLYDFAWLAYLTVFGVSLVSNLTIIAPVPFAVSVMVAAAMQWNPLIIALVGSIGGTLGELSGYYVGYFSRKLAIPEDVLGYKRIEGWIQKYGIWAISFLALQPVLPFDIGGFIAGAAKMPVHKFLPALWLGKFPKYLLLTYAGTTLLKFIPFLAAIWLR